MQIFVIIVIFPVKIQCMLFRIFLVFLLFGIQIKCGIFDKIQFLIDLGTWSNLSLIEGRI